jgi:hypothetical protein
MVIRRFRAFSFDRVLTYGGICGLSTWAFAQAVAFNKGHLPTGAWVAGLAALVCFWGISVKLFWLRWRFERAISFYTAQGVAVVLGSAEAKSRWRSEHRYALSAEIGKAMDFWISRYPLDEGRIRRYFNGATLRFEDDLIVYHGQGPEAGKRKLAYGLTVGTDMGVRWAPDDTLDTVLSLVRHEAGHVALNAVGITDEAKAHETFVATKYGA